MAFLRNDAINRVNLHSGIQALAQSAGGIFFLVFLLQAGISVPIALIAQAAIMLGRFVLRPVMLPFARRLGLKPTLIVGTLGVALQYPLLAEVNGVGPMLLALIVVTSVGEVFYWPSYHAYFATMGDAEHRGQQVSAREVLVAVANVGAPLLGAWALLTLGARGTFAAVGIVQALAILPLLGAPNVPVLPEATGAFRAARFAMFISAADGWADAGFFFVWQVALFVTLGSSIAAYGGAMALAGLVGALFGLLLGRHVDAGHGRRAVAIGYSVAVIVVVIRAVGVGSPWLAVVANAAGALALPLFIPPLGAAVYNLAKASPCSLRFQIVTEGGWDIGCFGGCLAAAGFVAIGTPLAVPVLLALPGFMAGAALLWHYYARRAIAARVMMPVVGVPEPRGGIDAR